MQTDAQDNGDDIIMTEILTLLILNNDVSLLLAESGENPVIDSHLLVAIARDHYQLITHEQLLERLKADLNEALQNIAQHIVQEQKELLRRREAQEHGQTTKVLPLRKDVRI